MPENNEETIVVENKVNFGFKNVHIAPILNNGEYGEIFKLNGGVNFEADPEGDTMNFSADDDPNYFTQSANNGYAGSLEVAAINEKFATEILGIIKDRNGVMIENTDAKIKEFAMMFEVDGDIQKRRLLFYRVIASRPTIKAKTTEESPDPEAIKMDIKAVKNKNGDVRAYVGQDKEAYNTFFDNVYIKTI